MLRTEPRVVHVIASGTQKHGKIICFGGGTTKNICLFEMPAIRFRNVGSINSTKLNGNHDP